MAGPPPPPLLLLLNLLSSSTLADRRSLTACFNTSIFRSRVSCCPASAAPCDAAVAALNTTSESDTTECFLCGVGATRDASPPPTAPRPPDVEHIDEEEEEEVEDSRV